VNKKNVDNINVSVSKLQCMHLKRWENVSFVVGMVR